MNINEFITRLDGVRRICTDKYLACCPAHDDQHPSLLITESDGRLLIHCRAGCRTKDVLAALGLDYPDLFLDSGKGKGTTHRSGPRQPERVPRWYWDWRSQCGELERDIQAKRERAEAMLSATKGLDANALTAHEFDEVMDYMGKAYAWLERCERLDEMLFDLQQTLRAEEQAEQVKKRKGKVAA